MKSKLLSTLLAFGCFSSLLAENASRDELMWKSAYEADFCLTYRMAITRPVATFNDELMNKFVMAYVYYRMGNQVEMKSVFKGIDSYIENVLILD